MKSFKGFLAERREFKQGNIKFTVAPRFNNLTDEQLLDMPVEVISLSGNNWSDVKYKSLRELLASGIKNTTILRALSMGAMYGNIGGKDALRFETPEAYKALSD